MDILFKPIHTTVEVSFYEHARHMFSKIINVSQFRHQCVVCSFLVHYYIWDPAASSATVGINAWKYNYARQSPTE